MRILDVGTGSGVLAIAAARALHRRVLATDIDASAVKAARGNVRLNRGTGLVDIIQANGVGARQIRARAPSISSSPTSCSGRSSAWPHRSAVWRRPAPALFSPACCHRRPTR